MDRIVFVLLSFLFCLSVFSDDEIDDEALLKSVAFYKGYFLIDKQEPYLRDYDKEEFLKGVRAALYQEPVDKANEDDFLKNVGLLEERFNARRKKKALIGVAQKFKELTEEEETITLIPGKLVYRVKKEGSGEQTITEKDRPNFCLISWFVDEVESTEFFQTEETGPLFLSKTIDGFHQAVLGMKQGESRVIYIHPDLGYADEYMFCSPGRMIVFEVTVLSIS